MPTDLPDDMPEPVRAMVEAMRSKYPNMTIEQVSVPNTPNMEAYEHLAYHATTEKRVALRLLTSDAALWLVNLVAAVWHTTHGSAVFAAGHWTFAAALAYRLWRELHHFKNLNCLLNTAKTLAQGATFRSLDRAAQKGD